MSGVVVIGVGPGIGTAVARRFAKEGLPVTLLARSEAGLGVAQAALDGTGAPVLTVAADCTDTPALHRALDAATTAFGTPDAVVYNAALIRPDRPGELSVREHQEAWAVNVVGAINAAAHIAPAMAQAGGGTFLITGGAPRPRPGYVSLTLGKAAIRAVVDLLDQEYGPSGVHVASITVPRKVVPGSDMDPDDIAEHYWQVHREPAGSWRHEVVHGTLD